MTLRLAAAGALITTEALSALATLGGLLLITYGAYMIRPFVGAIVGGVCLLVLGKLLASPAPIEQDESAPPGYEGVRRR